MSPPVFLAPGLLAAVSAGSRIELRGPEGRHAVTVRRLGVGEQVQLVDGDGLRVSGTVAGVHPPDALEVLVVGVEREPEPVPRLVVVQALAKGERADLAVEGLTEVGVDVVVPWEAARSVVRWRGDRADRGLQRWRRAAAEAAKQARRARGPVVADPADTAQVAAMLAVSSLGVVLHEEGALRLASMSVPATGEVVLVVGPEGGIAPDELADFRAAGAHVCRLGPTVLRTSTAGTAAAALVLAAAGRWD